MKKVRTLEVKKVEAGNKNRNPAYWQEFVDAPTHVVTYEAHGCGAELRIVAQDVKTAPKVGQKVKVTIEWDENEDAADMEYVLSEIDGWQGDTLLELAALCTTKANEDNE